MKPLVRAGLGAAAVAALCLATVPALASTFLKVDVPALVGMSHAVVHARVLQVDSAWNAEGSMIFSNVTLQVVRVLRGQPADTIVVRVPGGTVNGFTAEMEGAPQFTPGEEVVTFIGRWKDGVPMIAGYEQGVSRVTPDVSGNLILHGGAGDGMPLAKLAVQLSQMK